GIVGEVGHLVPGVPRLVPNEEVVLFLYQAAGGRIRVRGLDQGVYRVSLDRSSGERFVHATLEAAETVHLEDRTAPRRAPRANRPRGEFFFAIREKAAR